MLRGKNLSSGREAAGMERRTPLLTLGGGKLWGKLDPQLLPHPLRPSLGGLCPLALRLASCETW